jgi:hypothetical protein
LKKSWSEISGVYSLTKETYFSTHRADRWGQEICFLFVCWPHSDPEKISFLLSQKEEGEKAILRINQDYRSDNFNSFSQKILYLNEKEGGWKIVGEVAF